MLQGVDGRPLNSGVMRHRSITFDVKASRHHNWTMSTPKRATVYFDPEVHKALRLRAAANDQSISDMVNAAVKVSLAEDVADLAAFEKRKKEKSVSFESFVRSMKRRGVI